MPYIANTPESRLQRTDSKNPAKTCQGLTNDGKKCRRPLSKASQLVSSPMLTASDGLNFSDRGRYCWQHKDQANESSMPLHSISESSSGEVSKLKIKKRTSTDTLVDRLGLLNIQANKYDETTRPSQRRTPWQRLSAFWLCCSRAPDESHQNLPPVKYSHEQSSSMRPARIGLPKIQESVSLKYRPTRPAAQFEDSLLQTENYMSLISPKTSAEVASQLLSVLSKSASDKDSPGFIYMFWLTSDSLPSKPSDETASKLLNYSPSANPAKRKRPSEVLRNFSTSKSGKLANDVHDTEMRRKILLKIGRAQNVHRRLNEWTRQCGYNLSLVRYYPYQPTNTFDNNHSQVPLVSSSSQQHSPALPIRVPNVHKVERLIHIEISPKRAKFGKCDACGKVHKEWFEIDATRAAIKEVDEVVRRWVDWSIRNSTKSMI